MKFYTKIFYALVLVAVIIVIGSFFAGNVKAPDVVERAFGSQTYLAMQECHSATTSGTLLSAGGYGGFSATSTCDFTDLSQTTQMDLCFAITSSSTDSVLNYWLAGTYEDNEPRDMYWLTGTDYEQISPGQAATVYRCSNYTNVNVRDLRVTYGLSAASSSVYVRLIQREERR